MWKVSRPNDRLVAGCANWAEIPDRLEALHTSLR